MKLQKQLLLTVAVASLAMANCSSSDDSANKVTGVSISQTEATIEIGDTIQLSASVVPEEAADKSASWASSSEGVATVSAAGLVTAISEGIAAIDVTTNDGGYQASCNVTVVAEAIHVSGISLDISSKTLDLGCTVQLIATITPADAADKGTTWTSSDATVASVSPSGLVTAVSGGLATITVMTDDGDFTSTCNISVNGAGTITEIMMRGDLGTSKSEAGVDIAADDSGLPYLALNAYDALLEAETKASAEVWKYDGTGTSWSQFGTRVAITDDEAYAPSLAVADNGDVYVAHKYFDDDNDPKYDANVVASSSGANWTYVASGSSNRIEDGATVLNGGSDLAFKSDGTLLVASVHSGDGRVHYFDGTWKTYNGYKTDGDGFWAGGIGIAAHGNKPYVSVRTDSGDGTTGVLHGSETNGENGQWQWLADTYANPSSHDVKFPGDASASLALNSQGDVFTAYYAYGATENPIIVKQFTADGTAWETLYTNDASNIEQVEVVVADDILYLIVANYDDGIDIYKLNSCGEWIHEGKTTKPDTYYLIKTVAGSSGEFYIAYECTDSHNGEVGVYQYSPF